jgi:hypothetical protein
LPRRGLRRSRAVDQPAVAEREDLDGRAVTLEREADDVDVAGGAPVGSLPLGEVAHGEQAVAVAGGLLEALVLCRIHHLRLELALDRTRLAREELDHPVDDLAVRLLRDVADARRQAALDVVVEARDPGVAARLRPLARPVRKDAVEHVERLAHLLGVRVRPEVDDAAPVPLAGEHDARVFVPDGHGDVRERLVVPELDVERRPVALDEVLLEVERLDLVRGHDHLEVGDPVGQLRLLVLADALLEVAPHPRPQRLRLADVEHPAAGVSKDVDARLCGQPLQLLLEV